MHLEVKCAFRPQFFLVVFGKTVVSLQLMLCPLLLLAIPGRALLQMASRGGGNHACKEVPKE